MTKYFVDVSGKYLGGFDGIQRPDKLAFDRAGEMILIDGEPVVLETYPYEMPEIPSGAIEVPFPPEHAHDLWDAVRRRYIPHAPEPREPDLGALVRSLVKKGVISLSDIEKETK